MGARGVIQDTLLVLILTSALQKKGMSASLVGMGGQVANVRMEIWMPMTRSVFHALICTSWNVQLQKTWPIQTLQWVRRTRSACQAFTYMVVLVLRPHVMAIGGCLDSCAVQSNAMG